MSRYNLNRLLHLLAATSWPESVIIDALEEASRLRPENISNGVENARQQFQKEMEGSFIQKRKAAFSEAIRTSDRDMKSTIDRVEHILRSTPGMNVNTVSRLMFSSLSSKMKNEQFRH